MNNEDLVKTVTVLDERTKSLSHRVDDLETNTKALNTLATAIQVLITKQDNVVEKIDKLDCKVTTLEKRASSSANTLEEVNAKKWALVEKGIITAIVSGLVAIAVKMIWGG